MAQRKRIKVKSAKMVGSSSPLRARIARKYSITSTYYYTAIGIVMLTQELVIS